MNLPSLLTTVILLTSSAAGLVFTDPMDLELLPYQRTTDDHHSADECPAADPDDDQGDDDSEDGDSGDDGSGDGDSDDDPADNGTSSGSSSSSSDSNSTTSDDDSTDDGSSSSSSSDSNSTTSDDDSTDDGSSSSSSSDSNSTTSEPAEDDGSEANETEADGGDGDEPEAEESDCEDVEDGNETAEQGNETAEDEADETETEEAPEAAPAPNCAEVHINESGNDLMGDDRDWSFLVSPAARHLTVTFQGSYGLPGLGGGPDVTLVDGEGRVIASGDSGDSWGGLQVDMAGPMTSGLWTLSYSSEGILSDYWVTIDLSC